MAHNNIVNYVIAIILYKHRYRQSLADLQLEVSYLVLYQVVSRPTHGGTLREYLRNRGKKTSGNFARIALSIT